MKSGGLGLNFSSKGRREDGVEGFIELQWEIGNVGAEAAREANLDEEATSRETSLFASNKRTLTSLSAIYTTSPYGQKKTSAHARMTKGDYASLSVEAQALLT